MAIIEIKSNTNYQGISNKECEDYFKIKEKLLPLGASITLERSFAYNFPGTDSYDKAKENLMKTKFFSIVKSNIPFDNLLLFELSDSSKGFVVENALPI